MASKHGKTNSSIRMPTIKPQGMVFSDQSVKVSRNAGTKAQKSTVKQIHSYWVG